MQQITNKEIRKQRFSSTPYYKSTNTVAVFAQSPLVLQYQQQNRGKNFGKLAVDGLISYGKKHNLQQQSQQLAGILEKAIATKDSKVIGECTVKLYTMQSFLYRDINKFLSNADFEDAGSSKVISKCYQQAYDLLPFCMLLNEYTKTQARHNSFAGTVYRGCNLTDQHIKQYERNIGQYRQWNAFSSTTKNRAKAEKFGNTLFAIKLGQHQQSWGLHHGVQIHKLSVYPAEEEVLLWAGMQITVESVTKENGKWVITIVCMDMGP